MTPDEIMSGALLGSDGVCVDRRLLTGTGNTVIINDWTVRFEFNSWGYDEEGVVFRASYPSMEAAVADLEEFLGTPSDSRENINATVFYPPESSGPPPARRSFADFIQECQAHVLGLNYRSTHGQ